MIDLTQIWRLSDELPLAGLDKDPRTYSHHIKQRSSIIKSLSASNTQSYPSNNIYIGSAGHRENGPERRSIALSSQPTGLRSANELCFHVLLEQGIGIIALSDIGNELTQRYLDEIKREFLMQHSNDIDQVEHPHSFVSFERFIENTSRTYEDSRTKQNIGKLRNELSDVQSIVKQNIEEVIGRGDRLREMSQKSDVLRNSANKLKKSAVYANRMYLWKTYGPAVVTILIVLAVFILYKYVLGF